MAAAAFEINAHAAHAPLRGRLNEQAGDRWNAGPLFALSYLNESLGNVTKAIACLQEALIRSAEAGDKGGVNRALSLICDLERGSERDAEAYSHYQEAAQSLVELNNPGGTARCLECMAFLAIEHQQTEMAATLFGKADSLRRESGQQMEGDEPQEYDRYLNELKSRLSAERLAAAWNTGARQTLQNLFHSIGNLNVETQTHP